MPEKWADEASQAAEYLNPAESEGLVARTLTEVQLALLESPFRSLILPLLHYIDQLEKRDPGSALTIVLPEALPTHWWLWPFHTQTALPLKAALLLRPITIVVDVPLQVQVLTQAGKSLADHELRAQARAVREQYPRCTLRCTRWKAESLIRHR